MSNLNYSVLCNMYYQGSIERTDVAELKTLNYRIELQREEVKREFLDIGYKYRCSLIFKDLLGREIKKIVFNEAEASILVENISTFIYDDYTQMVALSNINGPSIYETYTIQLSAGENPSGDFSILFQLLCYNSMTQMMTPVLTTLLDLDELDNLNDMMFFIFLIDIASNREGIFQV